jgi:hypothetical protein
MTEEEAKTKWCPHVRALSAADSAGINRTNNGALHWAASCIGSECMAWRWERKFGANPDKPEDCMELPPTEGRCGLAGRP